MNNTTPYGHSILHVLLKHSVIVSHFSLFTKQLQELPLPTGTEEVLMNWSGQEMGVVKTCSWVWPKKFMGVAKDN